MPPGEGGVVCRLSERAQVETGTEWGVSDPGNCPATRPCRGAAWGSLTPHVVTSLRARDETVTASAERPSRGPVCALSHVVVQGASLRSALAFREARRKRQRRGLDDVVAERRSGSYVMAPDYVNCAAAGALDEKRYLASGGLMRCGLPVPEGTE